MYKASTHGPEPQAWFQPHTKHTHNTHTHSHATTRSVKERLAHEFRELTSAIPQPPLTTGQQRVRAGIDRQTRLAFR